MKREQAHESFTMNQSNFLPSVKFDEGIAALFLALLRPIKNCSLYCPTVDSAIYPLGRSAFDLLNLRGFRIAGITNNQSVSQYLTDEEKVSLVETDDPNLIDVQDEFHYALALPQFQVDPINNRPTYPVLRDQMCNYECSKGFTNRETPLHLILLEQMLKATLVGGYFAAVLPKKWIGNQMMYMRWWIDNAAQVARIALPSSAVQVRQYLYGNEHFCSHPDHQRCEHGYQEFDGQEFSRLKHHCQDPHHFEWVDGPDMELHIWQHPLLKLEVSKLANSFRMARKLTFAEFRYSTYIASVEDLSEYGVEKAWQRFSGNEWYRNNIKLWNRFLEDVYADSSAYRLSRSYAPNLPSPKNVYHLPITEKMTDNVRIIKSVDDVKTDSHAVIIKPFSPIKIRPLSSIGRCMLHEFFISMGGEPDDRESANNNGNTGNWVYTVKKLLNREPYVNVKEWLIKGLRERGLQPCILANDWQKLQRRIRNINVQLTPQERLIPVHIISTGPNGEEIKETIWETVFEEIGMKAMHPELLHMWSQRAKKMKLHMPGMSFGFQFENIAYLAAKQSSLFSDEPGLGKTRQTLFVSLLRCAEKVLLVVPAKLIGIWQEEIEQLITPYVRRQRLNWQRKPMKSDYQIIEWADQCSPDRLKSINIISYDKLKSTPRDGKFYKCPRCGMIAYSAKGMKEIPCPGNVDKYPEDDPRQCSNLIKAWREDCVNKGLRKYKVSLLTSKKVHWNSTDPCKIIDQRPAKPKIPMMQPQKHMYKKLRKVVTGYREDESGRKTPMYATRERDFHVKWTFAELLRWSFNHVSADEALYMKNADTKRSQAIKHVCGQSRYTLTGTPIKGFPQSVLSMLNWTLDREVFPLYREYERGGQYRFLAKYKTEVRVGGSSQDTGKAKQIPKINNPELFQSEIAPFMRRNTRSQPNVLRDIPKKEIDIDCLKVPMDEEHRAYYQKWIDVFIEWWELMKQEEEGKSARGELIVKLSYLRNASNIPHFMLEKIAHSKDAQFKQWAQLIGPYKSKQLPQKFVAMQNMVKEIAKKRDKVIVFSSRRANTDLGFKWAEKIGLPSLVVDGRVPLEIKIKTNRSERQERVDKFRYQDYTVMWAGLTALAEGMNIPEANHGIFMDYSWEPTEWMQALGRMIRPQQTKTIYGRFLCHDGTIDDYMAAWCLLKQKAMEEGVDYMEFDDFSAEMIPDIHQYADAIVDGTEAVLKQKMWLAVDKIRSDAREE